VLEVLRAVEGTLDGRLSEEGCVCIFMYVYVLLSDQSMYPYVCIHACIALFRGDAGWTVAQ
jgi:hypothetical protein